MPDTLVDSKPLKGGEFLIKESTADQIFIPEEMNDEQQMIQSMVQEFLNKELFPNVQ